MKTFIPFFKIRVSLILMVFLGVLSLISCHRDSVPSIDDKLDVYQTITIEEAQQYYKGYFLKNNAPTENARTASNEKPKKKKYPIWRNAIKRKIKGNEIIDAPLVYNAAWSLAKKGLRRMLTFKRNGKVESLVMQIVGEDQYLKQNQNKLTKEFTGHITFYDLDENFLGGFNYKNGNLNGYVLQVDGKSGSWYDKQTSKGGKVAANWFCGSMMECTSTPSYQVVYNPNGNNNCGPTATCQTATVTITNCASVPMDCHVQWSADYPIGDPTCLWYVDCSQSLPQVTYDFQKSDYDQFFDIYGNVLTNEELYWLSFQCQVDDLEFLYYYGFWYDIENDSNSNAGPFTSQDLQNWGRSKGLYNGVDNVRGNRRVGKAFERAAIEFLGVQANGASFSTSVRTAVNPNYPSSVIPDGYMDLLYTASQPAVHVNAYTFIEVKAVDGILNLSSNEYQLLGFLDALKQKRSQLQQQTGSNADPRVRPKLVIMTTSNTIIGQDIIQKANEWGIRIFQMKAYKVHNDYSLTPNDLTISFGRFIPLNFLNEASTNVPILEVLKNIINNATGIMRSTPILVPNNPDSYDQDDQ